ncbi:histidinol dehydrogenase [bacterium]|nr:histidinol dehydrogenase [bacterium]
MTLIKVENLSEYRFLKKDSLEKDTQLQKSVSEILLTVQKNGDKSLYDYSKKFDKVDIPAILVPIDRLREAEKKISSSVRKIFEGAIDNIKVFHNQQTQKSWQLHYEDGTKLGEKVTPLDRVGIYVPGGKAFYPSTMIMNTIPAVLAGVPSIIIASPPCENGLPHELVLAICSMLNIREVIAVGGAQAIAALAFGTESIRAVCKITGPGNRFVAEAKRQVFGKVGIDSIAGPSEIVILHDDPSIPDEYLARDLLTQAEHDEDATAILITNQEHSARNVQKLINDLVPTLPRKEIITKSLIANGKIILVEKIEDGIEFVNTFAPEHLELMVQNLTIVEKIKNAGAIFIGRWSSETIGDYYAGPNHTIPTSGAARYGSPLSVRDFQKHSSIIEYSKSRLMSELNQISEFAKLEGLFAHAEAVLTRRSEES